MKTRSYISILILVAMPLLYFTSCNKIKSLTSFDVTVQMPREHFTYTGPELKAGEIILYSGKVTVNLDSILSANGFSSGSIQTTTITNLTITMESPPDSTFRWLGSARATVADNENFSPETQVASVTNSDPKAKTLNVTVNNVDIRPLLSNPGFWLRVYGVINGPLPALTVGMYIDGSIKLHVSPLG